MDYLPLCDGPGERHIALAMLADDDPRLIDCALLKTEIVIHHPACRIAVNLRCGETVHRAHRIIGVYVYDRLRG